MDKSTGWFRVILTWIVIVPDLILSYYALRYPSSYLEITSLAINFIAATVLFYIYIDINAPVEEEGEEGARSREGEAEVGGTCSLYKLAFGSLIEDMLVWLGLFFLLYNIVPLSLYVHNWVARSV